MLDGLLSFYVRSVSFALSKDLDRCLKGHDVARGTGKITALLLIDSHPGIRASTIARVTLRDRPAISRIVAMLVEAGLVEQRRSATEGRVGELFITTEGKVEAETVRVLAKAQSDDFFAELEEADRAHLIRILRGLYRGYRKSQP